MLRSTVCLGALVIGLCALGVSGQKVESPVSHGSSYNPMVLLNADESFNFEILRTLSLAVGDGADLGEVLVAANQIEAGDFESYYRAFAELAERVDRQGRAIDPARHPVSFRSARFKAASYFRAADFYLHGNWSDARIDDLWARQTAAYDDALALLPVPGRHVHHLRSADGSFGIPAIFYGSGPSGERRPTMLIGNGFDGSQEEVFHVLGKAALDRGYNVLTYEGPGQPTVRRRQGAGFVPDWERVVSPVVDYALTLPEVDGGALGIVGYSLGGLLAARAAAFEPRITAVAALDGLLDFGASFYNRLPSVARVWLAEESGDQYRADFNDLVAQGLADGAGTPSSIRWALQHGRWAFCADDYFDFIRATRAFNLTNVAARITQPLFIADAELDHFFPGQAQGFADAATGSASKVIHRFRAAEGAGQHCSVGAGVYQNQVMYDWFENVFEAARNQKQEHVAKGKREEKVVVESLKEEETRESNILQQAQESRQIESSWSTRIWNIVSSL